MTDYSAASTEASPYWLHYVEKAYQYPYACPAAALPHVSASRFRSHSAEPGKPVSLLYLDSVLHQRQNPRLIIGREVEKSFPP